MTIGYLSLLEVRIILLSTCAKTNMKRVSSDVKMTGKSWFEIFCKLFILLHSLSTYVNFHCVVILFCFNPIIVVSYHILVHSSIAKLFSLEYLISVY